MARKILVVDVFFVVVDLLVARRLQRAARLQSTHLLALLALHDGARRVKVDVVSRRQWRASIRLRASFGRRRVFLLLVFLGLRWRNVDLEWIFRFPFSSLS